MYVSTPPHTYTHSYMWPCTPLHTPYVYTHTHTHSFFLCRFLYLSCNCSVPAICGLALDTLTNLAPFILLPIDGANFSIVSLLFTSIHQWILSSDKLAVLRGITYDQSLSLSLSLTHTHAHTHTHTQIETLLFTLACRSGNTWRANLVYT